MALDNKRLTKDILTKERLTTNNKKYLMFNHVDYQLGQQEIFKSLDFYLEENEVAVILGPSGVGKTTLLNLALGFDQPQKGEFQHNFRKISCVFQEPCLLPWFSALKNIELALKTSQFSKQEQKSLALTMGLAMGLSENDLQKYPSQLSGGMAKRVGFARGLVVKPDLILLDEPFNGIDMRVKESLYQLLIQAFQHTTLSAILVTHDLLEAVALASKVVLISKEHGLSQAIYIHEPYENRSLAWRFEKAAELLKQDYFTFNPL